MSIWELEMTMARRSFFLFFVLSSVWRWRCCSAEKIQGYKVMVGGLWRKPF